MIRIDAHHHYWDLSRGFHREWNTPDTPDIHWDALPASFDPVLDEAKIRKTVVVQAVENVAETEFLLELAASTPSVAGVVGWVDFTTTAGVADLQRLAENPLLLGLRPMLQDVTDTRWLFADAVQPAISALKATGLRFDALIRPWHLSDFADWASTHPDLPIVIDHAAKPLIAWRQYDPWADGMRRAASQPNVHCKISGMINNAGTAWDAQKLKPYVDLLLGAFGPDRLMFGSDWPMVDLSGDYGRWLAAVEELTAHLSEQDRDAIFGGTAARFYGVSDA